IKIFYSSDSYTNNAAINIEGGNGGAGGDSNGDGSDGSPGCNGSPGTYSQREIGAMVVTTDLPPEIPDSIWVNEIKRAAPYQISVIPGDSILIAAGYPPNPYTIDDTKYHLLFLSWDDGGDSAHWVHPVTDDTTFIAHYTYSRQFFCVVKKDPIVDTVGTLAVDGFDYTGAESDSQSFWWDEGSVHDLSASEVDSVDNTRKWHFNNWSDGGTRNHTTAPITAPETFTAYYIAQFPVTVQKSEPADTFGFFVVDVDTFRTTASTFQRFWWDSASFHGLMASEIDTIDLFNRYELINYSDGFDTAHITAPLIGPTDYIANYRRYHRCAIRKSPSLNTYGFMVIDGDTVLGAASVEQARWWGHGSSHDVTASTPDTVDSVEIYEFDIWSDGLPPSHTTAAIDTPCTLTAYYKHKFRVIIQKEPVADSCGWLALDSDTLWGAESVFQTRWWEYGSLHNLAISTPDLCVDSIYNFTGWSEPIMDTSFIVNIQGDTTFIAFYVGESSIISIWVSDTIWDIDTLEIAEVRTMTPGELIRVANLSNTYIDLGLAIIESADWLATNYQGFDRFSLRARFQESQPVTFSPSNDILDYAPHIWSSATKFGPEGFDMGFSPPDTVNMWLQFWAPTASDTAYGEKTIIFNVLARPTVR
ncbi:hypothetical protein DRQ36_11005, partial [bacterium]